MKKRRTVRIALTAMAGLLACGCAGAPVEDATGMRAAHCPPGRTPSCVERLGKPVRCTCADRSALDTLFEPESRR